MAGQEELSKKLNADAKIYNERLKEANKELKEQIVSQKNLAKMQEDAVRKYAKGKKTLESLRKTLAKIKSIEDDMPSSIKKSFKEYEKIEDEISHIKKANDATADAMRKAWEASAKDSMQSLDRNFYKKIESKQNALMRKVSNSDLSLEVALKEIDNAKEIGKKAKDELEKELRDVNIGFTGKMKMGGNTLKDYKRAFKSRRGKDMSLAGEKLTSLADTGKLGGKLGGVAKGVGGLTSKLGGMMSKLGPWGMAIAGVAKVLTAAISYSIELDSKFKAMNENFRHLAGGAVPGDDFKAAAHEFNNAITDITNNTALGVNKDEILNLFGAISDTGMSLGGVIDKMGIYTSAIESARRMSLQFGIDMGAMGGYMAEQMLELRTSVGSVAENFDVLSQDAKAAGLSSLRFYQAIEQSSLALGTYGNFLQMASSQLRTFSLSGALSQKTAEGLSQDFTTLVSNLSDTDWLASMSLAYGNERKAFEQLQAMAKGKKDEIDLVLKGDNIAESLKKELAKERRLWEGVLEAGSLKAQGAYKTAFTEMGPEILAGILSSTRMMTGSGNLSDKALEAKQLLQGVGIKVDYDAVLVQLNAFKGVLDGIIKSSDPDKLAEAVGKYQKAQNSVDKKNLLKGMETLLPNANAFTEFGVLLKANSHIIEDFLKRVTAQGFDPKNDTGAALLSALSLSKKSEKFIAPQDKQQQDKMIKAITPISKILGINKDAFDYFISSSGPQDTIAKATYATAQYAGDILSFMINKGDTGKVVTDMAKEVGVLRAKKGDATSAEKAAAVVIHNLQDSSGDEESKKIIDSALKKDSSFMKALSLLGQSKDDTLGKDFWQKSVKKQSAILSKAAKEMIDKVGPMITKIDRALERGKSALDSKTGDSEPLRAQADRVIQRSESDARASGGALDTEKQKARERASVRKEREERLAAFYANQAKNNKEGMFNSVFGKWLDSNDDLPSSQVAEFTRGGLTRVKAGELVVNPPKAQGNPQLLTGGGAKGSGGAPISVSMQVTVSGVSGDEVVNAIDRKLNQSSYWNNFRSGLPV